MLSTIILGTIFMLILAAFSSIPIFLTAYFMRDKGGYSKGVSWLLTIVCIIIYIVARTLIYELLGVNQQHGAPVPIIAMLIIYGLASLFSNKNKLSYLDSDKEYLEKKRKIESKESNLSE